MHASVQCFLNELRARACVICDMRCIRGTLHVWVIKDIVHSTRFAVLGLIKGT